MTTYRSKETDLSLLADKTRANYNNAKLSPGIYSDQGVITVKQIVEQVQNNCTLILEEGVYESSGIQLVDKHDIIIDAYNVVLVFDDYTKNAIYMDNCHNITIRGLTIDHVIPANTQGDVVSVEGDCLLWRAHEGYVYNLLDFDKFDANECCSPPGEGYRSGQTRPFTDLGFQVVEPTEIENEFILKGHSAEKMHVGDTIVFRGKPAHVNYFTKCSGINYEDITILSGSGFGVMEKDGDGKTQIDRMLITPGPKPYGCSQERLVSTCDAIHCSNMRIGVSAKNSIFEKMTDDAANIHSYFSKVISHDMNSGLLKYTYGTSKYKTGMAPVKVGDRLKLFVPGDDWQMLIETTAESQKISEYEFTLMIKDNVCLSIPEGTLIQNLSATSSGFSFENCLIENNRSRGILVKASHGVIRNCTFRDNGMSAILIKPEIPDGWGECGYVDGLIIENNLIERSGYFTGSELHSAINIEVDDSFQLHSSIVIRKNTIKDRYTKFAINASGVNGLVITDNIFAGRIKEYKELFEDELNSIYPDDDTPAIKLKHVKFVDIFKNAFPLSVKEHIYLG